MVSLSSLVACSNQSPSQLETPLEVEHAGKSSVLQDSEPAIENVTEQEEGEEQADLLFDHRNWVLDFIDEQDNAIMQEYVLDGETVDNWTELVTIQHFTNQPKTIAEFIDEFKKMLSQSVSANALEFKIIHESEDSIIYNFTIDGDPIQPNQTELGHIFKTKTGIGFIHFAEKKERMDVQKRKEWIELIKDRDLFMKELGL